MQLPWEIINAMLHCPYKAWNLNRLAQQLKNQEALSLDKDGKLILPVEKITVKDKLAALAWYHNLTDTRELSLKKITVICGADPTLQSFHIKVSQYEKKAKKLLQLTKEVINRQDAPPFYRNAHCPDCKFKDDCYKTLKEKDCISLLGSMTAKVLTKYHKKGIFTITQLSHLFRLRRRRNKPHTAGSYLWELKALALREQKTYVLCSPELPKSSTSIYIDFEGLPDQNRIYLVGVLIQQAGKDDVAISYWIDNIDLERECFEQLLRLLETYPTAIIYHYGSFESKHLKRAKGKWSDLFANCTGLENRMVNLLSYLRTHVYPPTYSNGLKDVAGMLGFRWREKDASGSKSIHWRKIWETSDSPTMKEKLLLYNEDDCRALAIIKDWFDQLFLNENLEGVQQVARMKRQSPYKFHANPEFREDYEIISKASYFEYQRSKIYWRNDTKSTDNRTSGVHRPGKGKAWKPGKIHEKIIAPLKKECPFGGHSELRQYTRGWSYIQTDLKFTSTGIRQWAVEHHSNQAKCLKCQKRFNNAVVRRQQLGDNVYAWAINLYVNYNVSYKMISRLMQEQFSIYMNNIIFVERNHKWWTRFKSEVEYLWKILLNGTVIHIDETSINIVGHHGYVWVFATTHTVFYHLTLNREADFLHERFKEYKGVIVTDFYPGYDGLPVKKQKCLIHLIRDLNDDLFKNPFDKEFADIVSAFSKLLRAIIQTIDAFGLKKRHLGKHKKDTTIFRQEFLEHTFSSELATKYTKRMLKYWNDLWTFLEYDGLPWNNNNAEAAIKAFAQHRHGVKGVVTEKGLRSYLEMLSMAQTCRYRNISFLAYLRRKAGIWQNIDSSDLPGILPFEQGRLFAQALKLNSLEQWEALVKSNRLPSFLPAYPHEEYENIGWAGYPDFLGLQDTIG